VLIDQNLFHLKSGYEFKLGFQYMALNYTKE